MVRTTASLIRESLKLNPKGVSTLYVLHYCEEKGAKFRVKEHEKRLKSISGQLSKMRNRGVVKFKKNGNKYIWSL